MTLQQKIRADIDPMCLAKDICAGMSCLLGTQEHGTLLPLHEPEFDSRVEQEVVKCIRSTFVSSVGSCVDEFERELAAACGVDHAIAMVNGTAALQVALRVAGVKPGEEVLLPSLTFVATPNAISHLGAVPHFVDVEEQSLGIDPVALGRHLDNVARYDSGTLRNQQTGRKIAAIVPVHVFGHPTEMSGLTKLAASYGIPVVEDAAEALGSIYGDKPCGSLGLVSAVSFNGNKIITTGGGGAVLTDDGDLATQARHLSTTAKLPHSWEFSHDQIAYNYRMPNINAALGLPQLRQLSHRVAKKRKLASHYIAEFSKQPHLKVLQEPANAFSNYWLNALILDSTVAHARDAILESLNNCGFAARPIWNPMHTLEIYSGHPRDTLSVTEDLASRIINLPSSAGLADSLRCLS